MNPGGVPHYFGPDPNYANTPIIRKFVDGLPDLGVNNVNNNGQYIPIAVPNTTAYPGCDYYEIELGEYKEKMHTDLPPTTLRGPPGGYINPKGNPVTLYNHKVNYGWGYVYHCHILGHEENYMMHSVVFAVAPRPPTDLKSTIEGEQRGIILEG